MNVQSIREMIPYGTMGLLDMLFFLVFEWIPVIAILVEMQRLVERRVKRHTVLQITKDVSTFGSAQTRRFEPKNRERRENMIEPGDAISNDGAALSHHSSHAYEYGSFEGDDLYDDDDIGDAYSQYYVDAVGMAYGQMEAGQSVAESGIIDDNDFDFEDEMGHSLAGQHYIEQVVSKPRIYYS